MLSLFENCFSLLVIPDINLINSDKNESKGINLINDEKLNYIKIVDYKNYASKKENRIKGILEIKLEQIKNCFAKISKDINIYLNDKKINYNNFNNKISDKNEKYSFEIICYEPIRELDFYFSRSNIISLDLSEIDTSNINDMERMFAEFINLKEIIGLNYFNTSKVENMSHMFESCSN